MNTAKLEERRVYIHRTAQNFAELVGKSLMSDERAIKELADMMGRMARTYFIRAGLPPWEAEDLAVTCVTDIFLKLNRYKPTGSFEAWVYTILRHRLIQEIRDNRRRPRVAGANPEVISRVTQQDRHVALDPQTRRGVALALTKLDPRDQIIIARRNGTEPLPFEQIAYEVVLKTGAVRVRYTRALKKLRKLLSADPRVQAWLKRAARFKTAESKTTDSL